MTCCIGRRRGSRVAIWLTVCGHKHHADLLQRLSRVSGNNRSRDRAKISLPFAAGGTSGTNICNLLLGESSCCQKEKCYRFQRARYFHRCTRWLGLRCRTYGCIVIFPGWLPFPGTYLNLTVAVL